MRKLMMSCALLGACIQQQQEPTGPNCGAGTVEQNGVCVEVFTPPPTMQLGSGATIYVWASASTSGAALGMIYVMVNDSLQGEISGYATGGSPSCGFNDIYSAIVSVAPGKSYTISAHDERSTGWPATATPVLTTGQCYSFRLN